MSVLGQPTCVYWFIVVNTKVVYLNVQRNRVAVKQSLSCLFLGQNVDVEDGDVHRTLISMFTCLCLRRSASKQDL